MENCNLILMKQVPDGKGGLVYVPVNNPPNGGSVVVAPNNPSNANPYEEGYYRRFGEGVPFPNVADRSLSPESLMGDVCGNVNPALCNKSRLLPPFTSDVGNPFLTAKLTDYNVVGTIGQARVAYRHMFASETQDVTRYNMVGSSPNFVATIPNYPTSGAAIGFVLDWGVQQLNFAPFDMQIVSAGFANAAGLSLDRDITLRVYRTNGCAIYVPFAQRTTPSMSVAQMQMAHADVAEGAGTITVANLPANIFSAFSATISLLSAFSPTTAAYSELESIMTD
jgi:hypothetical protein